MRLTLRTLLAYMDGLLESKDSQEIGKKIEDSKFATDLFHKIRDVMRRLRLGAPSVTERGANLDCNTVAEYLDNVLPGDRVPDFEEVCLKSEMHLAEVASAHQILTMVLGEPVEIEPESRQRMYQLTTVANRVDEERLAAAEAATALSGDGRGPVPPAAPPVKVRPRPVVPEYLRDPPKKRRLLPAAALTLFLGAAIGLILLMLGQLNRGTPIGNLLYWVQTKVSGKQVADETTDEGDLAFKRTPAGDEVKSSGDAAATSPAPSGAGTAPSGSAAAVASAATTASGPDKEMKPALPGAPSSDSPFPVPPEGPSPDKNTVGQPATVAPPSGNPPATTPKEPGATNPTAPATVAGPHPPIVPANPPTAEIKPVPPEKPMIPSVTDPNAAPSPPKPSQPANPTEVARVDPLAPSKSVTPPAAANDKSKVARFTSDGQDVLLKYDAANALWRRVLPEEFLTAGQPLLALPNFRSRIDIFDVGATLELLNGTRVEILPSAPQGSPGVDIDFGCMVIKPLAQAGARVRIVVGSHTGTITLANVETVAALEVTRVHDLGTNPEKALSHAVTKLYVARGSAVWEEGEGNPVRLKAPAEWLLDGTKADMPAGAAVDVPKWITANTINELDQRAALAVSQSLPDKKAATLGLMELTEDRRKEVSGLAARCLGYLGQFDPLTAAMNDVNFHRDWPDYFDQLEEAVARGPETAAGIRQSLEKQFGNDAADLYRMLWGYTDKDLEGGDDARLVKYLDHEALVFRVLAFSNLRKITHKSLFYNPENVPVKRQVSVQRWRQEQQAGKIRWVATDVKPGPSLPPAPLPGKTAPRSGPDAGASSDVKPISATEPIDPPGAPATARRPAVVIPEPAPPAERPKVVFPEP